VTSTGLPRFADVVLVPAAAVAAAFLVAGLVVLGIGENPLSATRLLIAGSLGSGEALGFTLFYATNFIFTGLAVAVAYHAGCSISAARARRRSPGSAPPWSA
jgi:general nucleoside transport system permease protein